MKYEMIFGDEKLFDGAPCDTEAVTCVDGFNKLYYKFFGHRVYISAPNDLAWQLRSVEITHCMMSAMRRIIQEPKRWMVEDQNAGRLPEVGNEVKFNFYQSAVMRQGVIKYIDDQVVVIQTEDVTRPFCYETCKVVFTPLETPEEKAKRLRDEWVEHALDLYVSSPKNDVASMGDVYDALLSGTLSVPTKGGE